jgi:hypothetical protein
MQDTELFLSLAEIAGVFVGFGALIAVRSSGPSEAQEISYMRAVVVMGMVTIVAALAPVVLDRYGVAGHQAWTLSAVVALVGFVVMAGAMARTPEYRASWSAELATPRPRWLSIVGSAGALLYYGPLVLLPIVIVLGVAPEQEAAFYLTFVVLIMLGAAWSLLGLVLAQRGPQPASGPAALPATGGSSA